MNELKAYKGDVYIPVYGSITDAQVYLKSEADKMIAEKDKEIRHHKYKRCLANAEACMYKRHMKKWLELAEQFKEAK